MDDVKQGDEHAGNGDANDVDERVQIHEDGDYYDDLAHADDDDADLRRRIIKGKNKPNNDSLLI